MAEEAGVSRRTIRYYVSEGLLPPPEKKGRYARYGSGCIDRLRLIDRLKHAYWPLARIRARISVLTDTQVSEELAKEEFAGVDAKPPVEGRSRNSDVAGVTAESQWHRYVLEEGVELHILRPLHPWRERIVHRLVADLRSHLNDW